MLNFIWFALIGSGILVAAARGGIESVTQSMMLQAGSAVETVLGLIGTMCLWLGILKIAEKSGLIQVLARMMRPIMALLFPTLPTDHPAVGSILMNLSANMLGMGSAATPLGLRAMEELSELNGHSDMASDAMTTFIILNTTGITLIPATVIGMRVAVGSTEPGAIIGPTIVATFSAACVALLADYIFRRWKRY